MARGEALTQGDTTAISRMTGNEFFEISRFGTLRTKEDNMRELGTGDLKLNTVKYDSLAVKVYGDVAILRGIADNTGTYRGFPFAGKIRYMRVFVKRDGRWVAVAMQHTPMP
jgi:ketosteroid isomerase-like protein